MKTRRFTQGITIFTTPEMYQAVKKITDEERMSISEFFRNVVNDYLNHSGERYPYLNLNDTERPDA